MGGSGLKFLNGTEADVTCDKGLLGGTQSLPGYFRGEILLKLLKAAIFRAYGLKSYHSDVNEWYSSRHMRYTK